MKTFGAQFNKYNSLGIQHVAFPSISSQRNVEVLRDYRVSKDALAEIIPRTYPYARVTAQKKPSPIWVLGSEDIPDSLKKQLGKTVIGVAPTADVYKISDSQPDLADFIKKTIPYYDYYLVALGLNVLLNKNDAIPELLFEVNLESENPDKVAVTAYDIAPDDKVTSIRVMSGKISLGITQLLQLIPGPAGQIIPKLLSIDLNPWEFQWNIKKYEIDAAGRKDYNVYWRIYKTANVQSFNPTIVLKVRKDVKKIRAKVKATYKLRSGLIDFEPEIRSKAKVIQIWP